MNLNYTPEAISDLRKISHYIKCELRNPVAARRIPKTILDACTSLKSFPEMGVSIEARTGFETDLRMLVCGNHIALYRFDTDSGTISVARIINARQDYMRLLFGEIDFTPVMEEQGLEEIQEDETYQSGPAMSF